MKGRVLLLGALALAMVMGSGIGNAASSYSAVDGRAETIDPILTRSSLAPVSSNNSPAPNKLSNANITSFSMSTSSTGTINATVTMKGPLVRQVTSTPGRPGLDQIAPYSGQHVLVLFQTDEFEDDEEVTGKNAAGDDVTWGVNGFNADKFRWFIYYGWNPNGGEDCGLGYYDPTGALVPPAPVFFGQTFFVIGQKLATNIQNPNTTCTISPDQKTVNITQPYTYKWSDRTGLLARQKEIVKKNDTIRNVSAFTWLDHEIGGPDPVGLIIGWTWYTDAVPQSSYRYGTIAGDPNPNQFMGPKCITNEIGGDPVTGPPGPCTIRNEFGAGFEDSDTASGGPRTITAL